MQSTRIANRASASMRAFAQKPLQPPRATSSPFSTGTPFTSFTLQQTSRSRPRIQSQQFRSAFTQRPPARRNLSFFRRSSTNATPPPSLSERLKKLSREYGWSALGVYFALSALDFPFCFLAVRLVGTERIGQFEHAIVSQVKRWIPYGSTGEQVEEAAAEAHEAAVQLFDHGVEAAETANMGEEASIWTQLALAYAIHKSFIFIRVPLTAAVTPKVVKVLRSWGWNIGKRRPKSAA